MNGNQMHWRLNSNSDSCTWVNRQRSEGVGKWQALRKVSLLRQLEIDLSSLSLDNIDLSELLGGKGFFVHTKVAFNNIAIPVQSIINSGASGPTFMDTKCTIEFTHFFNIPLYLLPKCINITAFDGNTECAITHVIILHLWVDGHRFLWEPILITDIGLYNMILGKNWLAKHNIWLDTKNTCLIWLDKRFLKNAVQKTTTKTLPHQVMQ